MRVMSELIGAEVRGPDGEGMGVVEDVRLTRSGPPELPGAMARLEVAGLIVSRRRHVRLWGYERSPDIGPWLLRVIVRRLSRGAHFLPWEDFRWDADGVVRSRRPLRELRPAADLPARPH